MAAQNREGAHSGTTSQPVLTCLLAWLIPGAGHLLLGKTTRGIIYAAGPLLLLLVGTLVGGQMHTFFRGDNTDGFLQMLASIGNLAMLGPHLIYGAFGLGQGSEVAARSNEYGTTFILIAALLNMLIVMDAWDIATGEKE